MERQEVVALSTQVRSLVLTPNICPCRLVVRIGDFHSPDRSSILRRDASTCRKKNVKVRVRHPSSPNKYISVTPIEIEIKEWSSDHFLDNLSPEHREKVIQEAGEKFLNRVAWLEGTYKKVRLAVDIDPDW